MKRSTCDIHGVLFATTDEAEEFCRQFRRRAAHLGRSSLFFAELVLREALMNAVLHGSSGNRNKQILCTVRLASGRVIIAVQDEGEGFDWRAVPEPPERSLQTCGRGIDILRKYSSRVRFNNKGNAVIVIIRFPEPEKNSTNS
jgi:anti-sigma regulatory factor (Ser/Thr protein kinase)